MQSIGMDIRGRAGDNHGGSKREDRARTKNLTDADGGSAAALRSQSGDRRGVSSHSRRLVASWPWLGWGEASVTVNKIFLLNFDWIKHPSGRS